MSKSTKSNVIFRGFGMCILSFFIVSCAIRPLPENVTRYRTYEISQKIRCELRDALRGQLRGFFKRRNRGDISEGLKSGIYKYNQVLQNGPRLVGTKNWSVFERYESGFVAYRYTFDITENNDLSGGTDFVDPLTRGMLKLGLSGHKNNRRRNERNFITVDQFGPLIIDPDLEKMCPKFGKGPNALYPIGGSLNLAETLKTFLDLNQSGNLVGFKADGTPDNIPTFADTIEFTTEIKGTISPSIELSAVGSHFQLTKAHLTSANTRTDIHKMTLTMTLPAVKTDAKKVDTIARRRAIAEAERQRVIQLDEREQRVLDRLLGL